jgi:bifunctional oligoribonuclease and PAP phosphatase NrnA
METDSATHLFGRVYAEVLRAKKILLVAHQKPDGDTLGSSSGFLNWCVREQKDVTVFCVDTPPPLFRYLDNIHHYTNNPAVFTHAYDLVIIFDASSLPYCGVHEHLPNIPAGYTLVNLDHHHTNERYADINIVLTDASSTAEVVYRFFTENRVHIDEKMATCLLTGLCTDTSNFSNAATKASTAHAASDLISRGGRFQNILSHVWQSQQVDALKLWGLMLSRLHYSAAFDATATYLLESDVPQNAPPDMVDGMSNFLNAVCNETDAIVVLREIPNNQVKGSMRAMTRDVSELAQKLGGGGHKKAAGFTVPGRIQITDKGAVIAN